MGFGIGVSVLTNNVAALAALANGVRPMRKVAALEAERRHLLEMQLRQSGFLDRDSLLPPDTLKPDAMVAAENNGYKERQAELVTA
jgi:hypothetical protein